MVDQLLMLFTEGPDDHRGTEKAMGDGWRARLLRAVHDRVPDAPPVAVRGAAVAVSTLSAAVVRNLPLRVVTVCAPAAAARRCEDWLRRAAGARCDAGVETYEGVLLRGRLLRQCSVWFDPAGAAALACRLRQFCGRQAPPAVCSLQHTISLRRFLETHAPTLLTAPTYPFDSIVCSSPAAACAMGRILEYVAEEISRSCKGVAPQYRGRIDHVPLCVDTERFVPGDRNAARKRLQMPQEAFVCLYVGYISLTKADLVPVLTVLANLARRHAGARIECVIAGHGDEPYIRHLLAVSASLGVKVRIERDVTAARKVELYQAADVFISPADSPQESFGLTPVEAMACGVPQVVADWDGYRYTVEHGVTGFLIPTFWDTAADDPDHVGAVLGDGYDHAMIGQTVASDCTAWSDALEALLASPDLRGAMGDASRRRALAYFSPKAVAQQYAELWTELDRLRNQPVERSEEGRLGVPSYGRCFGHYATMSGAEDYDLAPSRLGGTPQDAESRCRVFGDGGGMIDGGLARKILEAVGSRGGATSIRAVVDALPSWREAVVRRPCCWLAKHGFLAIAGLSGAVNSIGPKGSAGER